MPSGDAPPRPVESSGRRSATGNGSLNRPQLLLHGSGGAVAVPRTPTVTIRCCGRRDPRSPRRGPAAGGDPARLDAQPALCRGGGHWGEGSECACRLSNGWKGTKKGRQRQLEALVISSASLCSEGTGGLGSYREDPESRHLDDPIKRGRGRQGGCRPRGSHIPGIGVGFKREQLELLLALGGVQRPEQASGLLLTRWQEVCR